MDSNRRNPEDRSYQDGRNQRNSEENQRIGRDTNRTRGDQNGSDQYRSGRSNYNQNEGYSPEQTHYGSRPNSAYRDESRINFGDNRQSNPNQRPDQNQRRRNDSQYNQNYRQPNYENQGRDFDDPPRGDHAGTRFWGEREEFKQDDYRYTSGNRGNWHTPGTNDDDTDDTPYNDRYQNRTYNQPDQEEGFFDRMGRRIDNAWDRMTGSSHDDDDRNYPRNQHPQNRNFNRGYESGPRWADEDDYERQQRRNNRRNDY